MEPWNDRYADQRKKRSFIQKTVEAVVVIYAGFAICIFVPCACALAENITIPLTNRWSKKRKTKRSRNEGG
jgi:hypothetical protein